MTISDRVLAYLKERPGSPTEIAKSLNIKKRHTCMGYTYYWGIWSFARAEKDGLIMWKEGKWHLVETEG